MYEHTKFIDINLQQAQKDGQRPINDNFTYFLRKNIKILHPVLKKNVYLPKEERSLSYSPCQFNYCQAVHIYLLQTFKPQADEKDIYHNVPHNACPTVTSR